MTKLQKAILICLTLTLIAFQMVMPSTEGLHNIALVAMSIFTGIIITTSFTWKPKEDDEKFSQMTRVIMNTWIWGISIFLVYEGYMVMGMLQIFAYGIAYSKKQNLKKESDDSEEHA